MVFSESWSIRSAKPLEFEVFMHDQPPAGLQRYFLLRATHNSEITFEIAAWLAGRLHRLVGQLQGT